jgi:DNA-binding XRE family transcriptional regulator
MPDLRTPMPDLRTMRKRLGLSQAELAARLGVSRSTIIARELHRVAISRETILAMRYLAEHLDDGAAAGGDHS